MRLVYMGTPDFAIPPLEHLIRNGHQVVAVYTQPDKPAGRGRASLPSPVKKAALTLNLPVVQPESLKTAEVVEQLAEYHPDVIVVAAYGNVLPQAVLDLPQYGCINIHPSLLPKFRGASPVAAAILAGDDYTGVSIMLMDAGLDTGPLLAQERVAISPEDTTGSLTAKLFGIAAGLLQEVLICCTDGKNSPQSQNEAEATYSGLVTKEEGDIDWYLSAAEIWRRVRAFNPWPGSYTGWQGRRLKIIEAVPLPGGRVEVGRVVAEKEKGAGFAVGTGDGMLGVVRIQLEGKRIMTAAEFLTGQREFIGTILPD